MNFTEEEKKRLEETPKLSVQFNYGVQKQNGKKFTEKEADDLTFAFCDWLDSKGLSGAGGTKLSD